MANPSLRVTDFNDREILRVIWDLGDHEGYADLEAVAWHFFPSRMKRGGANKSSAMHSVAGRLNYMRWSLGLLERQIVYNKLEQTKYTRWTLSSRGEKFLMGHLTVAQENALTKADGGTLLAAAELVVGNFLGMSDDDAAVIRRQFQYGYGQRRAMYGRR